MIKKPISPKYSKYIHQKAIKDRIPVGGTFELTPLCNMICKMCYITKSKQEQESEAPLLNAEDWIKIAREAVGHGLVYLLLTGGEPFLYNGIFEILEELNKLGVVVSINTNATLLNQTMVDKLRKYPPSKVNVTLYGSSNDTYRVLCNNPYGFDQATRGIKLLKEAGINVKLNCTVTPANREDLPGILAFADKEDLIIEIGDYMFPPVRKSNKLTGNNFRLSPSEAAEVRAETYLREFGEDNLRKAAQSYKEQNMKPLNEKLPSINEIERNKKVNCGAGRNSFWINWKGEMLPCGMFPVNPVNVIENGFKNSWKSTAEFINGLVLSKKCAECPDRKDCTVCPASLYAETGSFSNTPVYLCRYSQELKRAFIKLADDIELTQK